MTEVLEFIRETAADPEETAELYLGLTEMYNFKGYRL